MNRRSYFVALVVLALVAANVVWWGGARRASANTIQPDRNSLALVPAQATTVFGMDMNALRASSAYAAWHQRSAARKHDAGYDEFVARTGFDVERDLEAVTAAAWKNGEQPAFLAVVTARYNPAGISSFLKEKGAGVENYGGVELLIPDSHHQKAGQDYATVALAVPDRPNTILAGTSGAVKQALDLRTQAASSAANNGELLARVSKIGVDNQLWAVSIAPGALLPPHIPPVAQANVARVLQGLRGSTFAVSAASDLRLVMEGSCATDEDARTLADAARGILAMLRLMAPSDRPEALQLLNSFQIAQQQTDVRVTAQISSQLLDELAEKPGMFLPQQHGHPHQHGKVTSDK